MALASDLLEQAYHLACREPKRPRQASLRRAVSTSCYALFHLLISEATLNWRQSSQRAAPFSEIPGEGNEFVAGTAAISVRRIAEARNGPRQSGRADPCSWAAAGRSGPKN